MDTEATEEAFSFSLMIRIYIFRIYPKTHNRHFSLMIPYDEKELCSRYMKGMIDDK